MSGLCVITHCANSIWIIGLGDMGDLHVRCTMFDSI